MRGRAVSASKAGLRRKNRSREEDEWWILVFGSPRVVLGCENLKSCTARERRLVGNRPNAKLCIEKRALLA